MLKSNNSGSKNKNLLIGGAIGLVTVILLYLVIPTIWHLGVKVDHWQRAKEPLICVKSHDVVTNEYGYGYGLNLNGKVGYGYGYHTTTDTVCDKTAPNPYYIKK